jgi:hypothetical protein
VARASREEAKDKILPTHGLIAGKPIGDRQRAIPSIGRFFANPLGEGDNPPSMERTLLLIAGRLQRGSPTGSARFEDKGLRSSLG